LAQRGARRQFVLLPVRGLRATSPGVTRSAASFLVSLTRHVGGMVRPIGGSPEVELRVVDSVSEDGPKLVEVSPEAGIALRTSRPDLRLVPLVYYRPAVAPRVLPRAVPQLAPEEPAQSFSVDVFSGRDATPQPGCSVVIFTDFRAGRGAQGVTDAAGRVTFQLGSWVTRLDRVYVYPPGPGFWGALKTEVRTGAHARIELEALDLGHQDVLRYFYGGTRQDAGGGVKVGVIDTGIDGSHPDITVAGGENTVPGEDPDDHGPSGEEHGTHVAGIIAARGRSGQGVRGVAPGVTLCSYRVFARGERDASNYAIIKAVDRAVAAGCDLLNISLSSGLPDAATRSAVEDARARGALCVVAAGNDRRGPVGFPASHPLTVGVAAMGRLGLFPSGAVEAGDVAAPYGTDPLNFVADFSNVGPEIDLIGPGVGVVSTVPGGYAPMSGTSMACPAVTGAAAAVFSERPDLLSRARDQARADALAQLLFEGALSLGFDLDFEGHGLPNTQRLAE
jgi:subtilisin